LHKVTAVYLNYPSLIVFPSFSDRHMFSWWIRNRCTYCLPSCSNLGRTIPVAQTVLLYV